MASLTIEGLQKTYANGHAAVRGIDLPVRDGELLVLVGPSGCGKSTVLRLVAGLETPTAGRVRIGPDDVTDLPPQERDVAMVFQSYALYPHKTVRDNLAFGLRMRRVAPAAITERVEAAARSLGLEPLLERLPAQLSGGQRQRVALGRAIVREPRVFLLDEPLSNLDAQLRVETRAELIRLRRRLGTTMLYVTHDQEEAMTLGDRIAVLREGRLEQLGEPLQVYRRPATLFVAGFVGSPAMNLLPVRAAERDVVEGKGFRLRLPASVGLAPTTRDLVVGIRPTDIGLVSPGDGDVAACVDVVENLGGTCLVHGALGDERDGPEIRWLTTPEKASAAGTTVGLRFTPSALHVFDAASGRRLADLVE